MLLGRFPALLPAFSAGMLLSVALFELLPEGYIGLGPLVLAPFVSSYGLLRLWHWLSHRSFAGSGPSLGLLGAGLLIGHSFFDGLLLGVGAMDGLLVALSIAVGIVGHDFCDGANVALLAGLTRKGWKLGGVLVLADALAPVLGTYLVGPLGLTDSLPWLLPLLAGSLLYLGLHELIPASWQQSEPGRRGAVLLAGLTAGILAFQLFQLLASKL